MFDLVFRALLPLVFAVATAVAVHRLSVGRRLEAPGLLGATGAPRRAFVLALLGLGFYLTVFQSVAGFGLEVEVDLSQIATWQLFWVHGVLLAMLGAWYALGFAGVPGMSQKRFASEWWRQFGLSTDNVFREVALGLGLGIVAWAGVLAIVTALGLLLTLSGGAELLPNEVPDSIRWMAAAPLALRLAIAVSAGVVEELFFRGFLQPRIGIGFSSLLFVLAHLSYGQPFLLVGVTLLSFGFAGLARWRGNIWAAITAHFTFDAVQLLVLIPAALRAAPDI